VPHPALDSAARVDELEREIVGAAARAQPSFSRDRVRPLDNAVLGQVGNSRRGVESRLEPGW